MSATGFDAHPRRLWEINDVMLGVCPLLACMEADQALENENHCCIGDLPAGWEWKLETRKAWATRKRLAMNIGIHIFWSMQVNHWTERNLH